MKQPVFKKIGEVPRQPMKLGRGERINLVDPEVGAANVDVHINLINVDSGPGELHYHASAENVYIVLEGTLEVVVEGERYLLGPNEVGLIPPGLKHTAGNAGTDGVVRVIEIYAPPGQDFHLVEE